MDVEDRAQAVEVGWVSGVEGEPGTDRCCCGEEIDRAPASCLASDRGDFGVHAPVRARGACVKRDGIECRFNKLKSLLPPSSLGRVIGGMRTGSKLGQRDSGDRNLRWQRIAIEAIEIDDHRRVDQPGGTAGVDLYLISLGSLCPQSAAACVNAGD